jgi:hypothetical protein
MAEVERIKKASKDTAHHQAVLSIHHLALTSLFFHLGEDIMPFALDTTYAAWKALPEERAHLCNIALWMMGQKTLA